MTDTGWFFYLNGLSVSFIWTFEKEYETTIKFQNFIKIQTRGEYSLKFWAYFSCRFLDCDSATDSFTFRIKDRNDKVLTSAKLDKSNFDLTKQLAWQKIELSFENEIIPGEVFVSQILYY